MPFRKTFTLPVVYLFVANIFFNKHAFSKQTLSYAEPPAMYTFYFSTGLFAAF